MQSRPPIELPTAASEGEGALADAAELGILRDVLRMLPAGVTVLDEHGRLLLVNDAAARQLGIAGGEPPAASEQLSQRRESGLELLRAGRAAVAEEFVARGEVKQIFLTAHRPVRIADRPLLLSSSVDISEQKAVEDHLFRSA